VQLVVGRIARAHGIGGEVAVDVHTDSPDVRFQPGSVIDTDPADRGPLTVERARWHSGRLLVAFTGVSTRTAAETLRNTLLVADSASSPSVVVDDEYWDHQLMDLAAVATDGSPLGTVADVLHPPGGDLLVVRRPDGSELLVPFVRAIVPSVDLQARTIVVDPPDGLLEL
jgi:16S rRNA processing protein RimM